MFFVALVAAMLDRRLRRYPQWALAAVFAAALTVSHYSTTYLAISMIGLTVVLQWGFSWLRQVPRVSGAFAVALAVTLVGAATWYGPVTHSTSNLSQFVQSAEEQGFNLLPNRVAGEGIIAAYLQGNTSAPMSAAQYARDVHQEYAKDRRYVIPLRDASRPSYALQDSAAPAPPVKSSLGSSVFSNGQVVVQQLEYLLAAVGALMLVLRRQRPCPGPAGRAVLPRHLAAPGGDEAERHDRGRVQRGAGRPAVDGGARHRGLLAAEPTDRPPATMDAGRRRRCLRIADRDIHRAAAAWPVLALGGGTATNLANSGEDYERFSMTAPELTAARWLGATVQPGQLVYADRYAQLPLIAMTGIGRGLMLDVTPMTLDQHAWVYAGHHQRRRRARACSVRRRRRCVRVPVPVPARQLQPRLHRRLIGGIPPVISFVLISKDEPGLDGTLTAVAAQARAAGESFEIVVVDASAKRLDWIRQRHEAEVRWVDFQRPPGVTVSIPHQRNAGVRAAHGETIVFTDAGCQPEAGWLEQLISPLGEGENVAAGIALGTSDSGPYELAVRRARTDRYLTECPTINLAFRREAFDAVGGFDETFAYGSDVDFSWRLIAAGYRIRSVPTADRPARLGYMAPPASPLLYVRQGTRPAVPQAPAWADARAQERSHRGRLPGVPARIAVDPGVSPLSGPAAHPGLAEPFGGGGQSAHRPPRLRGRRPEGNRLSMRVLVFPRDDLNPYQRLLYGEMGRLGARVTYLGRLTPSHTLNLLLLPAELAARRAAGGRLVHLHWVFGFSLPGSARLPFLRRLARLWFALWLRTVRVLGMRLVWTAHNVLPHGQVFSDDVAARRALVRASDLVLVHSPAVLAELAALGATARRAPSSRTAPSAPPCRGRPAVAGHGDQVRQLLFFGKVEKVQRGRRTCWRRGGPAGRRPDAADDRRSVRRPGIAIAVVCACPRRRAAGSCCGSSACPKMR